MDRQSVKRRWRSILRQSMLLLLVVVIMAAIVLAAQWQSYVRAYLGHGPPMFLAKIYL
jgi:hypothetical protein